jgi:hypothetical protein
MSSPTAKTATSSDLDDLTFTLVALLRADGHLCNVLTHVGSGNWRTVEQAIASILYPRTRPKALSNVARNILELVCDKRGVSGPIMRSYFFDVIERTAGRPRMKLLERKIRRLRQRMALQGVPVRLSQLSPKISPDGHPSEKMDDREIAKNKLRDKRVYPTNGMQIGKTMPVAECGRVVKAAHSNAMPENALMLVDAMCLHKNDPLAPPRRTAHGN